MTITQIKKTSITALLGASLLINPTIEASLVGRLGSALKNGATWSYENPKKAALRLAIAGFVHSIYLFHLREPDFKPNRYELGKLKNWELFKNQPKEYFDNVWYTYEDGLVGNCWKQSSIKAVWEKDPVTGKEVCKIHGKKEVPSRGIYGWIHSNSTPLIYACKFPFYAMMFAATAKFGTEFWTTYADFLAEGDNAFDALCKTTARMIKDPRLPMKGSAKETKV